MRICRLCIEMHWRYAIPNTVNAWAAIEFIYSRIDNCAFCRTRLVSFANGVRRYWFFDARCRNFPSWNVCGLHVSYEFECTRGGWAAQDTISASIQSKWTAIHLIRMVNSVLEIHYLIQYHDRWTQWRQMFFPDVVALCCRSVVCDI